jgi:glycosyltransferase involved in cell wall biosynthesis
MKIAVWHNLPSGGGKRALYDHVRGLVARGHIVEAWCPPGQSRSYCPLTDYINEHAVPISLRTDGASKLRRNQLLGATLTRLRGVDRHCRLCAEDINRGGFDILLANNCLFLHVPPIARYVRIPAVLYLQEPCRRLYEALPRLPWAALEPPKGWWRSPEYLRDRALDCVRTRLRRIQAREELLSASAFASILVNSYFSRESVLRAYGLDAKVCYLGIDTALFVDHQQPRKDLVVGIGAFGRHKNIEVIIHAVSRVRPPRPGLVWIGNEADEVYVKELTDLAQAMGVAFHPKVRLSDPDLVGILNCAKVMAYAPRLEPFGLAPLEANACGLPVVAVAEGGVRETVIDRVNGLLVEHDPTAMASAIQELLDRPDYARRLGENGSRLVAERWTVNHSIDRLESRLEELVSSESLAPEDRVSSWASPL